MTTEEPSADQDSTLEERLGYVEERMDEARETLQWIDRRIKILALAGLLTVLSVALFRKGTEQEFASLWASIQEGTGRAFIAGATAPRIRVRVEPIPTEEVGSETTSGVYENVQERDRLDGPASIGGGDSTNEPGGEPLPS